MSSIDSLVANGGSSKAPRSDDEDDVPADLNGLDIREDSEGWNDVEEDAEELTVKCLLCDDLSDSIKKTADHCQREHDFNIIALRKRHARDFYGSIKFVNYVRSQVQAGNLKPQCADSAAWQDDKYLQPVLENDAVLFSLDELDDVDEALPNVGGHQSSSTVQAEIATLKAQISTLQAHHDAYREEVSKTLEKRWTEAPDRTTTTADDEEIKYDKSYFESYSYNDIHQVMLQDRIRTSAYRDFIYDNKHLFEGKTVLDVGCGTGILSMFCAKAGAKRIFAVDNSAIIDKARQIAADNDLLQQITFVRGKIEDFQELPGGIKEVDIIVSEWMGYCLFFENMLPSVLYARDHFMKRRSDGSLDGLMVPSHCSIHIAPMADPDWIADNVTFWSDVYGFDMRCMMEGALTDVVVQHPPESTVAGRTKGQLPVRLWDLHYAKIEDLSFETDFVATLEKNIDTLDAWCIWFDMVFSADAPTGKGSAIIDPAEEQQLAKRRGAVTFSTGPLSMRTHWQCGVCVIDRKAGDAHALESGNQLNSKLTFTKGQESRGLDVKINWKAEQGDEVGEQLWKLA
ncbi:Ribosomal protein arginine N-methyltransferase rmt3 [Oleoguttula sp. CCFEE 5521]